ncbi:MAG: hypothetical protein H8M99_16195 [Gloeobacteraceae cyanobacterium ES-bin-144]|nr:hypothetical protein [Verrucomicrobiales bacterium]
MSSMNWFFAFVVYSMSGIAIGQEDPGKTNIGSVCVTVYYATNADPKSAGEKTLAVTPEMVKRFNGEEILRFKNYRLLGKDTQPLLRSYESWAEPLKPSDEVMVRFEAQGKPTGKTALLDLELWIARKKTVKTDARLEGDRPLFLLGPEWRGGRLIIAVSLVTE